MKVRLGAGAEFDLIGRFLEHAGACDPDLVRVGPGDDCAIVAAGHDMAISTDMSVEGVHFVREWLAPDEIGYRAAAAALSDLAAVAARPVGILVSLAVPGADAGEFAARLMQGARDAAAARSACLLGGDLTRSTAGAIVDVAAVGTTPSPVLRAGARSGDIVWVTGPLGGAAAAILAWRNGREPEPEARRAFARPEPRIAEALWLASHGIPRAMVDLSDGLAGDAGHIAAASGVAVVLERTRIPVHAAARAWNADDGAALELALAGGEDYELCFTAAPGAMEAALESFRTRFGFTPVRVGSVQEGDGVHTMEEDGSIAPLHERGYDHFREGSV